ncbi:MAG: response regulator [Candidatus Eisenbacteria bacterium]
MIAPHGHDDGHAREIAHGLATALRAATAAARRTPTESALAWSAAADVAELLQLEGLSALLTACRTHAGAPPRDVTNVLDRLERLATATEVAGDVSPFVAADRELAALAGVLDAQDWAAPAGPEPERVAVQPLAALLADLELDEPALIERAQVTLPVAAGLRAALDWLDAGAAGPLHVSVQDAALTLSVRVSHEPGLSPAGAVLALTGGALLAEPDGRWALRVPLHAERPAFLLARQGALALALPWAAVARLRITDAQGRAGFDEPSLAPWSPLTRAEGERPAALLAQGLKRAWLHLDHIVWRVFARPEQAVAPAEVPGGRAVVRTDEGVLHWVVEVGDALAGVPELHTPPAALRGRVPEAAPNEPVPHETEAAAVVAVEPAPVLAVNMAAPAPVSEPPRLVVLTSSDVRPLERPRPRAQRPSMTIVAPAPRPTPAAIAPLPPALAAPAPPAPVAAAPAPPAPVAAPAPEPPVPSLPSAAVTPRTHEPAPAPVLAPRRALLVDDSLVARIALARVLEREGWLVETAETAHEMWAALGDGDWGVVFVDVSLPDAQGRAHLRQLVARQLVASTRFELIALTRDAADAELVAGTGITRTLKKPFAPGTVEGVVKHLPGRLAGA